MCVRNIRFSFYLFLFAVEESLVYQIPEEVVLCKSCQQGGPWKNTCHYQSQVSEQKSMKIYMEKEGGVNTKIWQKKGQPE